MTVLRRSARRDLPGSWSLVLLSVFATPALASPLLEVLYLKHRMQPIDTTPTFNPMISEYKATLDWKMKFFAIEAKPRPPGIIDNIHLCQQNADCKLQDQRVVTMDFSKRILVSPGEVVLFMFDVLHQGVVKSYTIIVNRLEGTETGVRRIYIDGATLYPVFQASVSSYSTFVDVSTDIIRTEIHLLDGGQTVFATAEDPVRLDWGSNLTRLKNPRPAQTQAPPARLRRLTDERWLDWDSNLTRSAPPARLRRLTEELYGEFQYPKKYAGFPVPLMASRRINFKVISADGGHFGYYSILAGRKGCGKDRPLFDVALGRCVRFCNMGFYADYDAHRCKKCQDACVNCDSRHNCLQCQEDDRMHRYVLDNGTGNSGTCSAMSRPFWEVHPQEVLILSAGAACLVVFACGMLGFRLAASSRGAPRGSSSWNSPGKRPQRSVVAPRGSNAHYASLNTDSYDSDGGY